MSELIRPTAFEFGVATSGDQVTRRLAAKVVAVTDAAGVHGPVCAPAAARERGSHDMRGVGARPTLRSHSVNRAAGPVRRRASVGVPREVTTPAPMAAAGRALAVVMPGVRR